MGAIVDWIMDFLYNLASLALAILPDSPFQIGTIHDALAKFGDIMSYINYFIPFGEMLKITMVYLTAVLIWYGVRWVLRLAKYIE